MPALTAVVLGTGAGVTKIYHNQPSSSFCLCIDDRPEIVFDVGLGVVFSALSVLGNLPKTVYVSHNHTDHAGELPVLLHVEGSTQRVRLVAERGVMQRLKEHRLNELQSTGQPLNRFVEMVEAEDGFPIQLLPSFPALQATPCCSRHSERCFGLLFHLDGQPVLGWTADSGYDEALYSHLAKAPVLLMDGRHQSSKEHASFDELQQWAEQHPRHTVMVTGYGTDDAGPDPSKYPLLRKVAVGQTLPLFENGMDTLPLTGQSNALDSEALHSARITDASTQADHTEDLSSVMVTCAVDDMTRTSPVPGAALTVPSEQSNEQSSDLRGLQLKEQQQEKQKPKKYCAGQPA